MSSRSDDEADEADEADEDKSGMDDSFFTASASNVAFPGEKYVDRRARSSKRKNDKRRKKGRSLSPLRTQSTPDRTLSHSSSVFDDPEALKNDDDDEENPLAYTFKKYIRKQPDGGDTSKSGTAGSSDGPAADKKKSASSPRRNRRQSDYLAHLDERSADRAEMAINFEKLGDEFYVKKRHASYLPLCCVMLFLLAGITGLILTACLHFFNEAELVSSASSPDTSPPTPAPIAVPTQAPVADSTGDSGGLLASLNPFKGNEEGKEENAAPIAAPTQAPVADSAGLLTSLNPFKGTEEGKEEEEQTTETSGSKEGTDMIPEPDHIPHAPDHLHALCMQKSLNECETYCAKAECCWRDGVENCDADFMYRCPDYERACYVLKDVEGAATAKDENEEGGAVEGGASESSLFNFGDNKKSVPPAPDNLGDICSLDKLTTGPDNVDIDEAAYDACEEQCNKAECCWKPALPLIGSDCRDDPECGHYSLACKVLVHLT